MSKDKNNLNYYSVDEMEVETILDVEAYTETLLLNTELMGYSNVYFFLRTLIIRRYKIMKGYSERLSFFAMS